jgi:hypothetical protein
MDITDPQFSAPGSLLQNTAQNSSVKQHMRHGEGPGSHRHNMEQTSNHKPAQLQSNGNKMSEAENQENQDSGTNEPISVDPNEVPYLLRILNTKIERLDLLNSTLRARVQYYTDAINHFKSENEKLAAQLKNLGASDPDVTQNSPNELDTSSE